MIVDIIVLVIVLISALISVLRGFIRETFTIIGVIVALAASYYGGDVISYYLKDILGITAETKDRLFGLLPYDIAITGISYFAIFVIVLIVVSLATNDLAKAAGEKGLGAIDRTLGFLFGVVRAVILLGLLYIPVHSFADDETKKSWFGDSRTHVYLEMTSEYMLSLLPDDLIPSTEKKDEEESSDKAREILKGMKLLGDQNSTSDGTTKDSDNSEESTGYDKEERNEMNELFKEESSDYND